MTGGDGIDTYHIGFWTHRWWPTRQEITGLIRGRQPTNSATPVKVKRRVFADMIRRRLNLVRRPHRPWQAEYEGCQWCRRAFTAEGAHRKAARDRAYQLTTGQWSPWVQRKVRTSKANR